MIGKLNGKEIEFDAFPEVTPRYQTIGCLSGPPTIVCVGNYYEDFFFKSKLENFSIDDCQHKFTLPWNRMIFVIHGLLCERSEYSTFAMFRISVAHFEWKKPVRLLSEFL